MSDIRPVNELSGALEQDLELSGALEQDQLVSGALSIPASRTVAPRYADLPDKPSINEVELIGNKTFEDLGDKPLSNFEIKAIHDRVFGN